MARKEAAPKPRWQGRPTSTGKIEVRTPNVAGYRGTRDAAKYEAMRKAVLGVLPKGPPGLTQAEMVRAVAAAAPDFPGSHPWWAKTVQLDLETKGVVVREPSKPLRWHRT